MEPEIHVFEEAQGWAYRVGGVYQPYHQEKDGFVGMTEAEATAFAQALQARLTPPAEQE